MNNLSKRSFEKIRDLPLQKDIKPGHGVGREFDELVKDNKSLSKLSSLGQKMINRFKREHMRKIKRKKKKTKEEELLEYRHSKPPLCLNPWKPANHVITEFSILPADKVHSFIVEKKNKNFLVQEPFRIPKKDGDYFYDRNAKTKPFY